MRSTLGLLSHIGSLPVCLPPSVTLGSQLGGLRITGPKGATVVQLPSFIKLDHSVPRSVSLSVADGGLAEQRSRWGLSRTLINNAVVGVSVGYSTKLNLVGVGYRASMATPTRLHLKLGFAHPVLIDLPEDVTCTTPTSTEVLLSGIDKQRIGQVAASIRSWRVPEPYNGKGIFVGQEQVRRKEVKKK